jgi:hypothetical protein
MNEAAEDRSRATIAQQGQPRVMGGLAVRGPIGRRSVAMPTRPCSPGRDYVEHPLVQRLPVGRDSDLHGAESHRARAHERVRAVLRPVLDVVVRSPAARLGLEVRDVVRAAEFEGDDVVDLDRAPVETGRHPLLALDRVLLAALRIVDVWTLPEQITAFG